MIASDIEVVHMTVVGDNYICGLNVVCCVGRGVGRVEIQIEI